MNSVQLATEPNRPRQILIDATGVYPDRISSLKRFLALAPPHPRIIIWFGSQGQADAIVSDIGGAAKFTIRICPPLSVAEAMLREVETLFNHGVGPVAIYSFQGTVLEPFNDWAVRDQSQFTEVASLGKLAPPHNPPYRPSTPSFSLPANTTTYSIEELRAFARTMIFVLASQPGLAMHTSQLKILMEAMDERVPRGKSQQNGHPNFMRSVTEYARNQGFVRVIHLGLTKINPRIELVASHPDVIALLANKPPSPTSRPLMQPLAPMLELDPAPPSEANADLRRPDRKPQIRHPYMNGFMQNVKSEARGPYQDMRDPVLEEVERIQPGISSSNAESIIQQAVRNTWRDNWYKFGNQVQVESQILDLLIKSRVIQTGKKDFEPGWKAEVERQMIVIGIGKMLLPWPDSRYDMAAALFYGEIWRRDKLARERYAARVNQLVLQLLGTNVLELVEQPNPSGTPRTFLRVKQLRITT